MEYAFLAASALVSLVINAAGLLRRARTPKILVIKLDHMGDVITATPVLRALRESYRDAPIHALVGPWATDILAGNPFVGRIEAYDSRAFRRGHGTGVGAGPGSGPALRRVREIAAERYTHVVDLRGDAWTLLLPFLCGATTRVDRGTVRTMSWIRRHLVPARGRAAPLHEVETNLAVVRPLLRAAGGTRPRVDIFLTDRDRTALAGRLRALGVDGTRPIVTIHPGASWRPRAWHAERFAEVGRQLLAQYSAEIVFVGGPEDGDIAEAIRSAVADPRAHFLFGSQSLREVAALIARSALMIGNDSGLAHIAAACDTPLVALFGPQDPRRFRPWSDSVTVLHKPVECFPCRQSVCVRPDLPCVNLIEVEEVVAAARPILDRAVRVAEP